MKRTLSIITMVLIAVCTSAQESNTYRDKVPHLHFNAEFNIAASEYNKGKPDFGIYGVTVSPGYRFDDNWAVYIPVSMDVVLMNRQSIRNFVEQGTIGLGASYQLSMKDHTALVFTACGGSTYIKSDLNYFKAKAAINFGIHGIGASPYIGIGCSYLKAYQNSIKDRVMFEATLGITMF